MRQYAAEKLEASGEADEVRRRHAQHFLAVVVDADPHLRGPRRPLWVQRLLPDIDNLRDALAWTRARDPRAHVRLLGALHWFWYSTGHWTEAEQWTSVALELDEAAEAGRDRAALLFASGAILSLQGRPAEAQPRLEEAVDQARAAGDGSLEAYALTYLGMALGQVGSQEAVEPCRRAAAWFDAHDEDYGHRLCHLVLGTMAAMRGDMDEALAENEEGTRLARRFGMPRELGISVQNTGLVHIHRGELGLAEVRVRESLDHLRRDPSHFFIAISLDYLGEILGRGGRLIEAARLLGAAEALRELVGAARFPINERRLAAQLPGFEAAAGAESWAEAWRDGRALAPDRILDELPSPTGGDSLRPRVDAPAAERVTAPADPARATEPPDLEVRALGPFEALVEGEPFSPDRWSWAKPREALVFLLLHPEGVTRDRLGAALWPDSPPSRMKNSFHVALHHLRKSLGHPEWIVVEGDRYRLAPGVRARLDALEFEAAVRGAGQDPEGLRRALALWRGELLEDEAAGAWVEERRDRLGRILADASMALGGALEAEGRTAEAAESFQRVVLRDPLREDAQRRLMAAWWQLGQRSRALRHYEGLAKLLRSELDTSPEPETVALYESLRAAGERAS